MRPWTPIERIMQRAMHDPAVQEAVFHGAKLVALALCWAARARF